MNHKVFVDSGIINLTVRMRTLIHREFGVLLSLQEKDAEMKFCTYGFKSKQLQLQDLARKLASKMALPLPELTHSEDSFIGFLCSEQINFPVLISSPVIPEIIIDKPRQRCLVDGTLMEILVLKERHIFKSLSITPLTEQELENLQQCNTLNLDSFMWFCGKQLSEDRLLPPLEAFAAMTLKQWPDFGRLPHYHEDIRMATLLLRKGNSLEALLMQSKVIRRKAIAFLNACYLCDLLTEAESMTAVHSTGSRQIGPNFLDRIRFRLGMQI